MGNMLACSILKEKLISRMFTSEDRISRGDTDQNANWLQSLTITIKIKHLWADGTPGPAWAVSEFAFLTPFYPLLCLIAIISLDTLMISMKLFLG